MARNKKLHVEMALLKMTYANRAVTMKRDIMAAAIPEKKTVNLAATAKAPAATIPATPPPPVAPPPVSEIQATQPLAKPTAKPAPTNKVEEPKPTGPKELTDDLRVTSKHNFPKISSLDALDKMVDAEGPDEQLELDLSRLKAAWESFTATLESPTTRMSFERAELSVEGLHINAKVGSPMSKSMIQEESGFMPFLRRELKNNKLVLNVDVDSTLAPSTEVKKEQGGAKAFTVKDRYEAMREINPLIDELMERFDLKPES